MNALTPLAYVVKSALQTRNTHITVVTGMYPLLCSALCVEEVLSSTVLESVDVIKDLDVVFDSELIFYFLIVKRR